MRTLTNDDGGVIVERLETFEQQQRTYSYSIAEAAFPVTGYLSTLRVHEVPGHQDAAQRSIASLEFSGDALTTNVETICAQLKRIQPGQR